MKWPKRKRGEWGGKSRTGGRHWNYERGRGGKRGHMMGLGAGGEKEWKNRGGERKAGKKRGWREKESSCMGSDVAT